MLCSTVELRFMGGISRRGVYYNQSYRNSLSFKSHWKSIALCAFLIALDLDPISHNSKTLFLFLSSVPTFFTVIHLVSIIPSTTERHSRIMTPTSAFVGAFSPIPRCSATSFMGDAVCAARPTTRGTQMVLGTKPSIGYGSFGAQTDSKTYTVTVVQGNGSSCCIRVTREENLRKALLDAKIDVYTLKGKLTNCGGGGSCGTCLISVEDGMFNTNGRAAKEDIMLESKPDNWRLACRTLVHGDVTIRTKPKQ